MKKIIDQNGRLFGRISILDVLVILLVVVLALSLQFKQKLPATTPSTNNAPITFQAEAEAVPTYVAQAIQVGDSVYDKDQPTGGAIGVITAVEILPGAKHMEMTNGTVALVDVEDSCNVLVTVEGSGLVDNGRFAINRIYEVGVNASRNLYTKYALFKVSITQVW